MARKIREKETDIIYDEDLVDTVDEKFESDSSSLRHQQTFDEDDKNLEDAFDSLNLDDYITDSQDTTKIVPKQKRVESLKQKPNLVKNPFEEETKNKKATYSEVVDEDYQIPRMDVRPYTPIPAKKSKKRFKLWLVSGVCCACLLVAATLMGVFGVGVGAGTNALYNNNVETGELASNEGIVNKSDSALTEDQVRDWLSGGKNLPKNITRGKTSGNSAESQEVITNSSVWDKICDFFSGLFGR